VGIGLEGFVSPFNFSEDVGGSYEESQAWSGERSGGCVGTQGCWVQAIGGLWVEELSHGQREDMCSTVW
jgi:hypothetical protein